mgnify:CR=1 FL=1
MSDFIGTKLTMNLGERSYDIIVNAARWKICTSLPGWTAGWRWSPTAVCPHSTHRW